MEMEPAAAWGPYCEYQMANSTVDEPGAEVWAPAAVLPDCLDYAFIDIDIFGACCSLQAPVPASIGVGEQQLVDYFSVEEVRRRMISATQEDVGVHEPTKKQPNIGEPTGNTNISNNNASHACGSGMFEQEMSEFKTEMNLMKEKMHRYPSSLLHNIDTWCTVPWFVAIGPYHHHQPHLEQAEKLKVVAAICCINECGDQWKEMYNAVASIADDVRCLYDEDVMEGISSVDFQCMMFVDACFLVQYMRMRSNTREVVIDRSLHASLSPNRNAIFHDVMLLENQLPWTVVDTIMRFLDSSWISKDFVYEMEWCLLPIDHRELPEQKPFIWYEEYKPPHLLGLLRYYIVGRSDTKYSELEPENMSFSLSAMDLAEIGITLKANKTMQLIDMHLKQKGAVCTELCLAPLFLDRNRASYLFNMAALELCTVESFGAAKEEDSAVCSYVMLLANLVYREEEVQELRARDVLQRGGGLTNAEALCFFTSFQDLRMGPRFYRIMQDIATYREKCPIKTELHGFYHNNKKVIAAFVSGVVALIGIIGTLLSIKNAI